MQNTENYTMEQYQALCNAKAQGVLSVEYDGKKITYRSVNEMNKIQREMEAQLFPQKRPIDRTKLSYKSGF